MIEATQYRSSAGQELARGIALSILRTPKPTYATYDLTARFAQYLVAKMRFILMHEPTTSEEAKRLEKHIARYEDIIDRHTHYE